MEKVTNRIQLILLLLLFGAFSSTAQNQITGTLTYHDNWGMDNSTVYLMDLNNNILDSCATNAAGEYVFNNVTPGDYLMTASTDLPAGGVDLGDAFLIMLNLYNMYTFNDIQELAADVDGDGVVTWDDYFTIVVGWFNYGYPFPVGDWVFETVPVSVTSSRDGGSGGGGGIGSSSTGDVGGLFIPDKNFPYTPVEYLKASVPASEAYSYSVEINSADALGGFHLNLAIPEGVTVTGVTSELQVEYNIEGNQLLITWVDSDLLKNVENVVIELELNVQGTDAVRFANISGTHFIGAEGEIANHVTLKFDDLEIGPAADQEATAFNLKVGPNPFIDRTNLWISSDNITNNAVFAIYDGNGNIVKEFNINVSGNAGQQVNIDLSDLSAGIYHYRLWNEGKNIFESGSMIKLR